jgi:hypothetical protein
MNLDGFELKIQNEEILMLTEMIAEKIAKENEEFKDFLKYKKEEDFICHNIDTDKFLKLIIKSPYYYEELRNVTLYVLQFMKFLNNSPKIETHIKIKEYDIKNNFIFITFNTKDDITKRKVKIDLYDIMWGILMFKKNRALFQIIYDEIFVASFI